jgi:hypothetical protein
MGVEATLQSCSCGRRSFACRHLYDFFIRVYDADSTCALHSWNRHTFSLIRTGYRQPESGCRPWVHLLAGHGDGHGFFGLDEVIRALGILGDGELNTLDATCKFIPARPVVG